MGALTKQEREREVADRFCSALGPNWHVNSVGDKPDCVVSNGAGEVGLELVRYRSPGPDNDRYEVDWNFKQYVHDQWLYDADVHEFSSSVVYCRDSAGRATVPRRKNWSRVVSELKLLVKGARSLSELQIRGQVRFAPASNETIERRRAYLDSRCVLVSSADLPVLAGHFQEIHFTHHAGLKLGTLSSDLNSAFVGVSSEEVRRLVRDKLDRISSYRSFLSEPCWLLIHSDGWPLSACVGSEQCVKMGIEVARSVLRSAVKRHCFDAVWWLNDTWSDAARSLHQVWPEAGSEGNPRDRVQ